MTPMIFNPQPPTVQSIAKPVQTASSNPPTIPINGLTRLIEYGVSLTLLLILGATSFWPLAYMLEGAALLSLLLSDQGVNAIGWLNKLIRTGQTQ